MARTPIHPGSHPAEEVKELGISGAESARQIDVPVNRVTSIINGQRGVTADTALRLGHWFGTSPESWLNLQTLYELRVARLELGDSVEKLPRLVDQKPRRPLRPKFGLAGPSMPVRGRMAAWTHDRRALLRSGNSVRGSSNGLAAAQQIE